MLTSKKNFEVLSLSIAFALALISVGSLTARADDAPAYPVFDKKWEEEHTKKTEKKLEVDEEAEEKAEKEEDKRVAEQERKNAAKRTKLRKKRGEKAEIGGGVPIQKVDAESSRTAVGMQVEGRVDAKSGVVGGGTLGYLDDALVGGARVAYRGAPTVVVNGKKKSTDGFIYEAGGSIEGDPNSVRVTPDISMGYQGGGNRVLVGGKAGYYKDRSDEMSGVSGQYYALKLSGEKDIGDIISVGAAVEKGWICGQNAAPELSHGFNENGEWETTVSRPATEQEECGSRLSGRAGVTVKPLGQRSVYLKGEAIYGEEKYKLTQYNEEGDPSGTREQKDKRVTGMVSAGFTW